MNTIAVLLVVALAASGVLAAPKDGPKDGGNKKATTQCPPDIKPAKAGPAAHGGTYTTKYDNLNVEMVLHNERLLKNYIDCLMDRKPCSKEGQLLKEIIPDALQTECSRCSEKQKQIAGTVMSYLLQYKKKYWDELLCKYDPEGSFREKYEVDEDDEEED